MILRFRNGLWPDDCRECRRDALALTGRAHVRCMACGQFGPHGYRSERRRWRQEHACGQSQAVLIYNQRRRSE